MNIKFYLDKELHPHMIQGNSVMGPQFCSQLSPCIFRTLFSACSGLHLQYFTAITLIPNLPAIEIYSVCVNSAMSLL